MKVLQINAVYGIGSTGRAAMDFDIAMRKQGISSLAATMKTAYQQDNIYIIGNYPDHKAHALFSKISGKQAYFSRYHTKKLLRFINKEKPDIVHLGNLHSNFINLPMLLKFLADKDIATVITLHDCWFFTGKCTHYISDNCYKWKNGCFECPRLKKDNTSWFFDKTRDMWQDKKELFSAIPRLAVIGVSDWITNEARQSFLKDAAVIRRIYNGIDTEAFKPCNTVELRKKLDIEDKFVVLGVSVQWTEAKGLDTFIQLAKEMPDIVFFMIGNMPAYIKLPDNVISKGRTDSVEELVAYYSMADVFLNPSHCETFGLTTAEALSCGTPVIGNNITAIPELINEECGIVVDIGDDITGLKNAVNVIREKNKALYTEACRRFAVDNFTKDKIIEENIRLYRELSDK